MVRSCRARSAFMFARRKLAGYQRSAYKILLLSVEYRYISLLSYLLDLSITYITCKEVLKRI